MFFCLYTPPPQQPPIEMHQCRLKHLDGHPWEDDWNKDDDWDKECIDLPKGLKMSKEDLIQHLDAVIFELTVRSHDEWRTKVFDEEIRELEWARGKIAVKLNIKR